MKRHSLTKSLTCWLGAKCSLLSPVCSTGIHFCTNSFIKVEFAKPFKRLFSYLFKRWYYTENAASKAFQVLFQ